MFKPLPRSHSFCSCLLHTPLSLCFKGPRRGMEGSVDNSAPHCIRVWHGIVVSRSFPKNDCDDHYGVQDDCPATPYLKIALHVAMLATKQGAVP